MKWGGTCEQLADVDAVEMASWITAIPFEDWPQQHQVDDQLRPAMVSDPNWHDFGRHAKALITNNDCPQWIVQRLSNMMLSVVMPGHRIERHQDIMEERWICRVHIPLVTNPLAKFIIEAEEFEMIVGGAYAVNISRQHAVVNGGITPRIHFMFDCYES